MKKILFLVLFLQSCALTQVNYKASIEDENRYKDTRYGLSNGIETIFSNGTKIDLSYRLRIIDFDFNKSKEEHDILGGINVPIWKK